MKKFNLAALTATVLMSSVLLSSGNAMAVNTSAAESIEPGTACSAYYPAQNSNLTPDWSTVKSSANTWVHCPGSGTNAGMVAGTFYVFNLEIPVDAVKDIYNCYLSAQSPTSTGATNRKTTWKAGSSVGLTPAVITIGAVADYPVDDTKSYTSGCYMYQGQMLHSVNVTATNPAL